MKKYLSVFALSVVVCAGLTGCSEEQPQQRHVERRSGLTAVAQSKWISPQDDVRPEVWLIAHESKSASKPFTGKANEVRRALDEASAKFNDTPRMIANRAVQLEDMLKENGGDETALVLISRLSDAIAPGHIESFGAAGLQYYNLRKAGYTDEQALDALSKRYGSRS